MSDVRRWTESQVYLKSRRNWGRCLLHLPVMNCWSMMPSFDFFDLPLIYNTVYVLLMESQYIYIYIYNTTKNYNHNNFIQGILHYSSSEYWPRSKGHNHLPCFRVVNVILKVFLCLVVQCNWWSCDMLRCFKSLRCFD